MSIATFADSSPREGFGGGGHAYANNSPAGSPREPARGWVKQTTLTTFADLFCGIGGFHVAASNLGLKCVFASDIDADACDAYEWNFNARPSGDITGIDISLLPDHDILFAGLPCQPFSIIGNRQGFADRRGNLFLEAARVIAAKCPKAVIIENVRQFKTNSDGKPFRCVVATLEALGYDVRWKILNALHCGLPQKRERLLVVALSGGQAFSWPDETKPMKPLSEILESDVDKRYFVSDRIRASRLAKHTAAIKPAIWHENRAGNVTSHPFSCALRASASYNYLLVDGERRLTPREMLRLQGFPEDFRIPVRTAAVARRLTGNAVPPPMIQPVIERVLRVFCCDPRSKRWKGQSWSMASGGSTQASTAVHRQAAGPQARDRSEGAVGMTSEGSSPRLLAAGT